MAITGVSSISGEQIIAAGALSARSAATALYDENGNAITSYLTAVPEGYATTGDLNDLVTSISETYQPTAGMTAYQPVGDYYSASNPSGFITEVPTGTMNESAFGYDSDNKISSYNGSAIGGSAPTYGYTDNGLISSIDTSGLYASSAGFANNAISADALNKNGTMGGNIAQSSGSNTFLYMPLLSPWTTATVATGIFSPLQYATGACLAMDAGYFKAYFKGNEWFVSNTAIGQALRGETHNSRGVHISGATTAGYGFDLNIKAVSGVNSTGSWKYGHAEDAALRAVSSCDMHESAFEYDANNTISGYNGSAFAGQGGGSNVTTANTGNDYNINVEGLDVYGTVTTKEEPAYEFDRVATAYNSQIDNQDWAWSNYQFDNKSQLLQSATKIIFTLYDCDPSYWPSDSLEFNVLFSANGFDSTTWTNVEYSALIGNIKMDITGNYPPPGGEIRVLTANLDIPSAMREVGSFSIDHVCIGFSGNFDRGYGEHTVVSQLWSAEAGYDEVTGTSSSSGIYIPNINDITAMSASIGDVETLLASL